MSMGHNQSVEGLLCWSAPHPQWTTSGSWIGRNPSWWRCHAPATSEIRRHSRGGTRRVFTARRAPASASRPVSSSTLSPRETYFPAARACSRSTCRVLDHTPLYFSSHRAIVPGDIFVRAEGELRLWWVPEDEDDLRFLNERHIPTLRSWLESPVDHVLTSHGTPTIGGGGHELAAALARPIWSIS